MTLGSFLCVSSRSFRQSENHFRSESESLKFRRQQSRPNSFWWSVITVHYWSRTLEPVHYTPWRTIEGLCSGPQNIRRSFVLKFVTHNKLLYSTVCRDVSTIDTNSLVPFLSTSAAIKRIPAAATVMTVHKTTDKAGNYHLTDIRWLFRDKIHGCSQNEPSQTEITHPSVNNSGVRTLRWMYTGHAGVICTRNLTVFLWHRRVIYYDAEL